MLALVSREPGPPSSLRLEEVEAPKPGPGKILVAVRACGVNYPDALIIEDRYQFKPDRPFSPGGEIAGEVIALGEGVSSRLIGDHVLAFTAWGGMAEQIVVDAGRAYSMPETMPFDTAAAFIMTYGTAYHALHDRARVISGETVLVLGAAGGVGLAAIELAKVAGARVIAAVSSAEKAAITAAHGADATLVYPRETASASSPKALANLFKEAVGTRGVDVVVDPVGGDYADAAIRTMNWGGRYLVLGFTAGVSKLSMNLPLLKGCAVIGVFWGRFSECFPEADQRNARVLFQEYLNGKLRPEIASRYPLSRAAEAIEALATRAVAGKLVITMEDRRPKRQLDRRR